jgi:hypothetical protein
VKNRTRRKLAAILLCASVPAGALDRELVLGQEDAWQDLVRTENLILQPGLGGTLDLYLAEDEYPSTPDTDLLLHFDREPFEDSSGHYRLLGGKALLASQVTALGEASAGFTGERQGLELAPLAGALFARGTRWGDFSIEFWLHPALLSDGEEVLGWIGSRFRGGHSTALELRCTVRKRTLAWEFTNFFSGPRESVPASIRLEGLTPLLPRAWHHHLLRYDSSSGLLEYLVDGVPEAVTYVRDPSGGEPLIPHTGEADSAPLVLGSGLIGFLDELRISRSWIRDPVLSRYSGASGSAESRPLDLGYTGTRVKRIDALYRTQADSGVFFYYRTSDRLQAEDLEGSWRQIRPGEALGEARGRFVQLRVELFPDGRRRVSPRLSELRVVYEQALPPAPPTSLAAAAGNGRVRLAWSPVREEGVRGYLVYYGYEPGNYHGADGARGPSPIDVGAVSEFTLDGLKNGRLYYFAVVAYDGTEPPHHSGFSREVSARPSGALP